MTYKMVARRGAATHNDALYRINKSIITRKPGKRHNILVDAMLRGSFYGAMIAAILFLIYSKVNPFLGGVCSCIATAYIVAFLDVNARALFD